MTTQDLKNNRNRILRTIKNQNVNSKYYLKVMTYMVKYLPIELKPFMKNIDELTHTCLYVYFRDDYKSNMSSEEIYEESNKNSLPSSLR